VQWMISCWGVAQQFLGLKTTFKSIIYWVGLNHLFGHPLRNYSLVKRGVQATFKMLLGVPNHSSG